MSVKSKIQSLIAAANAKTGESDTTLTDAVQTLCDGYGQGGSEPNDLNLYAKELYRTFYGAVNLPDTVTVYAPNCDTLRGTFAGISSGAKVVNVTAGTLTNLREGFVGGTSASGKNSTTETVNLNCSFSNCNFSQGFNHATALRTINGELDLTGGSAYENLFNGSTKLVTVSFKRNSISLSFNLKGCSYLSDASLISIANGLNPTAAQTLTLHATPFARCAALTGTVSDGVFTANAGGTVTLDDFISDTKGWTLVSE